MSRTSEAAEFLKLWLELRQWIQALNFNRFQGAGLSATQFSLLNSLNTQKGTTVTELAKRLNLGSPTVVRSLDSLERRGFIVRNRSDEDRRQVEILLTPEGRSFQNHARGEFTDRVEQVFSAMSAQGRAALLKGYREFLDQAKKQA